MEYITYHTMIGLMSKVVDDILPDYRPIRIRGILQTPIKDDYNTLSTTYRYN